MADDVEMSDDVRTVLTREQDQINRYSRQSTPRAPSYSPLSDDPHGARLYSPSRCFSRRQRSPQPRMRRSGQELSTATAVVDTSRASVHEATIEAGQDDAFVGDSEPEPRARRRARVTTRRGRLEDDFASQMKSLQYEIEQVLKEEHAAALEQLQQHGVESEQGSHQETSGSDSSHEMSHPSQGPASSQLPNILQLTLQARDPAIQCTCPVGTIRLAKDITMRKVASHGISWIHRCNLPAGAGAGNDYQALAVQLGMPLERARILIDSVLAAIVASGWTTEKLVKDLSGSNGTAEGQLKLKHFTSTFLCDGPCNGSKEFKDYVLCNKCCAWQHSSCMIYGKESDKGGPICNRCYLAHLLQYEEVRKWQRQQLLKSMQEALEYYKDPKNQHQAWRLAYIRNYLEQNRHSLDEFVTAQEQDVADNGTLSSVATPRRSTQIQVLNERPWSAATGDGLDDPEELGRRADEADNEEEDEDYENEPQSPTPIQRPTASDRALVAGSHKGITGDALRDLLHRYSVDDIVQMYHEAHPNGPQLKSGDLLDRLQTAKGDARNRTGRAVSRPAEGARDAQKSHGGLMLPRLKTIKLPTVDTAAPGAQVSNATSVPLTRRSLRVATRDSARKRERSPSPEEDTTPSWLPTDSQIFTSRPARKTAPGPGPANRMSNKTASATTMPSMRTVSKDVPKKKTKFAEDKPLESPQTAQRPVVLSETRDVIRASSAFSTGSIGRPRHDHTSASTMAKIVNFQKPGEDLDWTKVTNKYERKRLQKLINHRRARAQKEQELVKRESTPRAPAPDAQALAVQVSRVPALLQDVPEEGFETSAREAAAKWSRNILWAVYARLPGPHDDLATTDLEVPGSPPEDWLAEMSLRLGNLLVAAGHQKFNYYFRSMLDGKNDRVLFRSIGDLVNEELYRGSYKRRRTQLGVLLEVTGLEDKGTYWKV